MFKKNQYNPNFSTPQKFLAIWHVLYAYCIHAKMSFKIFFVQVWFQNRRARYRKQERTGSISCRSRYRQKRLEKLQHNFMPSPAYPPTHYPPTVMGGGNTLSIVSSPSISTTSPVSSGVYDFSQGSGFSFQTSFYPVTPSYRSYSTNTAFQYPGGLASLFQNAPSTAEGK